MPAAMSGEEVPAGHGAQVALDVAWTASEKVPGQHSRHADAPPPLKVPAPHAPHADALDPPLKVPASHATHADAPDGAKVPAPHATQEDACPPRAYILGRAGASKARMADTAEEASREQLLDRLESLEKRMETLENCVRQLIRRARREKERSKWPERDEMGPLSAQNDDEPARFAMPAILPNPGKGPVRARRVP